MKKSILFAIFSTILVSGCSHKDMAVNKKAVSFKKMNEQILNNYHDIKKEDAGVFYYQKLVLN